MEEAQWLEKLRSGDKAAFERLVMTYRRPVLNTCFRFVLNQKDAEDLAQETFIEVYQSIRSFKGPAGLSSWIQRIAVTKSLDELKRRKRHKRFAGIGKMLHLDDVMEWLSGGKRPDASLEEKEKHAELLALLDTLPENQRVAFTLSKLNAFSNPEIAMIMGTTLDAVESLIYRAKSKLTTDLKKILKK